MKHNFNVKRALALVTVLLLLVTLFVACDPLGGGSSGNDKTFEPPVESGSETSGGGIPVDNKVSLTGEQAMGMVIDSMNRSIELNQFDATVLNFEFETFLDLNEALVQQYYAIQVKGSIDLTDDKKSLLSVEIISQRTGVADKIIFGAYAMNGSIYLDLRNSYKGEGIHVFKVDNINLAWFTKNLQGILKQLDLGGFMEGFKLAELVDLSSVEGILDTIGIGLSGNIPSILTNILANSYAVDKGDGVTSIIMPTKLNNLIGMLGGVLGGLLTDDIYELVDLIFGWDVASIMSGLGKTVSAGLFLRCDIKDGVFKKMSLGVVVEDDNTLDIDVGMKDIVLGKKPTFSLPDFTGVETEDYSFTRLNLDLIVEINATQHTYNIAGIDTAFGQLISGLIGEGFSFVDPNGNPLGLGATEINIVDDTVFRLQLKLRADIDLKDNDNTEILLEILGGETQDVRAGVYYIGKNDALYIDLSGMGGGRYMIDSYSREIAEEDPNGRFIRNYYFKKALIGGDYVLEDGEYVEYDEEFHADMDRYNEEYEYAYYNPSTDSRKTRYSVEFVQTPLDLAEIIRTAIDGLVPTIPSIMSLISGDAEAASEDENYDTVKGLLDSGEVLIEHYSTAESTADGELDVLGLIKKILLCATITKGETKMSFDQIMISLSDDVIAIVLDAISPGLSLPITKLDVLIDSSTGLGLDGLVISAALGDPESDVQSERELLTLGVSLLTDYGNAKDDYIMPDVNSVPFMRVPLSKDELGNMTGLTDINLSLNGAFRLQANQGTWDLSPLEEVLVGLVLQLDVQEDIDMYYGFDVQANLNLAGLIAGDDILGAIEARIELTKNPGVNALPSIIVVLTGGKLYIDATKIGIPKIMLDIGEITEGNIQLFGGATGINALSAADEEDEGMSTEEILALIAGLVSGINIDSTQIEVALAANLLGSVIGLISPELAANEAIISVLPMVSDGSGIAIHLDGLNLSELYIDVNLGLESNDNKLDLGLGLGHIGFGLNKLDLVPADVNEYYDILADLNIYLGIQGSLVIELAEGEIDLNNIIGALLVDMASNVDNEFKPKINVEEDILAGIDINIQASVDLKNAPENNNTQLIVELRGTRTGKLLLGAYYEYGKLYVDGSGLAISKFVIEDLDLITIIKDLINAPDESEAQASADVDLSGLEAALILSKNGLKVKLLGGLTTFLLNLIVGDTFGSIDGVYKYILESEATDVQKQASVDFVPAVYDTYIKNGYVLLTDANAAEHASKPVYNKVIDENLTGGFGYVLEGTAAEEAVLEMTGEVANKYVLEAEDEYTKVTTENEAQFADKVRFIKVGASYVVESGATAEQIAQASGYIASSYALFAKSETGFVQITNENSELFAAADKYVKYAMTEEELGVYDVLANEGMAGFDLPEIGAVVDINLGKDTGKPLLNALSINILATIGKDATSDPAVSLAIRLGNIDIGVGMRDIVGASNIDKNAFAPVTLFDSEGNVSNLDLFVEIIGALEVGAYASDPEVMNYSLGNAISQFAELLGVSRETDDNGNELFDANGNAIIKDNTAIYNLLCAIMIKFNVVNDLSDVTGFRIAGNVALGSLLGDSEDKITPLLSESELLIELYNDAYGKGQKLIGIYLKGGVIYINLSGNILANSKLKLDLVGSGLLDGLASSTASASNALATADGSAAADMSVRDIGGLINGLVSDINITNESISINLGANLIGAILGLVLGGSGYNLPILNEENSFISWGATDQDIFGAGVKCLKISLGIDPVYLSIALGGFRFSLAHEDILPADVLEDSGYKSITDLTNISLSVDIGIDLKLKEGVLPVGDIVSTIAPLLGTDLDFGLDINIEDDIELNLRLYLQANLNVADLNMTEIFLELWNEPASGDKKKVLGVYLVPEPVLGSDEVNPTLYVDSEVLKIAKFMMDDFDILSALLQEDVGALMQQLNDLLGGSGDAAAAADALTEQQTIDILFDLSAHNLKIVLTESIILGLLTSLAPDVITPEVMQIIDDLNLQAAVAINTVPFEISVTVDTDYLALGVFIAEPRLSIEPIEDLFVIALANKEQFINYNTFQCLSAEIELAIKYHLYGTEGKDLDLSSILKDLTGLDALQGDDNAAIRNILNAVALKARLSEIDGEIVIKIVANILLGDLMATPEVGANGNWWIYGEDTGIAAKFGTESNRPTAGDDGFYYAGDENTGIKKKEVDIWKMLEAGVFISFDDGAKTVVVSLKDGILYAKLDDIGGPNISLNLLEIIDGNGSAASNSLSTDATAAADLDLNVLLNNIVSDIVIQKGYGLDITIAPQILSALIDSLAPGLLSDESLQHLMLVDETTDDSAFAEEGTTLSSEYLDNRPYAKVKVAEDTYNYKLVSKLEEGELVYVGPGYEAYTDGLIFSNFFKTRHSGISFRMNDLTNGGRKSLNVDIAFKNGFDLGITIRGYSIGAQQATVLPLPATDYIPLSSIAGESANDKLFVATSIYLDFAGEDSTVELGDLLQEIMYILADSTKVDEKYNYVSIGNQLAELVRPTINIADFDNKLEIQVAAALDLNALINEEDIWDKLKTSDISIKIVNPKLTGVESVIVGLYLSGGELFVQRRTDDPSAEPRYIKYDIGAFIGTGAATATNALATADAEEEPALVLICEKGGIKIELTTALIEELLSALLGANLDFSGNLEEVNGEIVLKWAEDGKALDLNAVGLDIGINLNTLHIGLGIKDLRIGIADDTHVAVPEEVKNEAVAFEELVLDLGLDVGIGLDINDINLITLLQNFGIEGLEDLDDYADKLTIHTDDNVGEEGAYFGLLVSVAASLNLSDIDKTNARIDIKAKLGNEADDVMKTIIGISLVDGVVYADLSTLFGEHAKLKILGVKLSTLLGIDKEKASIVDLISALATSDATAAVNEDNKTSLDFNNDSIVVFIGSALLDLILEAVGADVTLPAIRGALTIQYLNNEGKLDLEIRLDAEMLEKLDTGIGNKLLGAQVYINNINLHLRNSDAAAEGALVTAPDDAGNYAAALELGIVDGSIGVKEILLDKITLGLELNLNSMMDGTGDTNEMDITDFIAPLLSAIDYAGMQLYDEDGNPIESIARQLALRINAEVGLAGLIDAISAGDILANLGGLLQDINLAVELVKTYSIDGAAWESEEVILGIYVFEGDAYIYLGGLGLPNIRISNEFLVNIFGALGLGSATANSLETANATAETGEIIAIIANIVNTVTLAEKALTITLANDFIFPLLQTLVPDIIVPEFTGIFPEFGKLADGTEGNKIALNLGAFTSPTPTGLLAIDLQFYGLNVGIDLYPPVLGCYDDVITLADADRIKLPIDADSDEWVYFSNTSTELNVALTLAGSLGLTQGTNLDANGVCTTVLGDVLGNLVGDLSTKLIMKDDVIIDFEITASLKVIIDLTSETPAKIDTLDLAVSLLREGKLILGIFYDGAAKTAYLDASHLFANPDGIVENIGNNATGKLAIQGLDLVGLITGALGSSTAVADAENALSTASVTTQPDAPNFATLIASTAIWAEFGPNSMLVTITGALVNAIINRAAPDAGVEPYLPKLAVQLNAGLNPMFLNIDVDVLDDNYDKALGIQIGLKGFDYDDFNPTEPSSALVISGDDYSTVSAVGGMDFSEFRPFVTLDLDKLTGGDIAGGLKFENDVINVSLGVKIGFDANNTTGENGEDWAKYLAKLFGLSEDEFMILIDILGFEDGASNTELKLTIDAAINLAGLLNGLDLTGTEARITLETNSDITSNELHPNGKPTKIVITLIGNEGNGMSGIYLDLSGYRGKGKHRISLDLVGLIGGIGSAAAANTGMLGEQIFNILDGLLDSVVLADGAISVNLKRNALDALFNLLLPEMNITDTPPINGGVSIDLRNLNIGVLLGFGELDESDNYTMTKAITIGVGYISLAKPDGYEPNKDGKYSFIYDTSEYYDLTELQLNVDLLGELTYTGVRSSSTNPPIDLSSILDLIKIDGKPLVENPLLQLRIAADMGTTYTINTHIFLDLADFSTLKISLEVVDTNLDGDPIMIGAYLDGENVYIDLSSLGLPKLSLDGINLADILEGAIGGFLGHEAKGSAANALATSSDEGGFGNVLLSNNPLPYVALVFRPEAFAIGINAAFIDTIINLVKRSQGEDVEVGARMLPDFGDIAILGDSRTFWTKVSEASEAEKINIRERYVSVGVDKYELYDEAVHGPKTDSELYIKIGGKLLPELAIKISDGFYGSVKLNDVHINGNYAKINNVDLSDSDAVGWQTANSVFAERVEGVKFQSVYNLKTGELGLDKINAGLDICLRFMNINPDNATDYSNSFQYYFSVLINSLLGTDASTISNFKLNVPTGTVGYVLTVKLSTSISQLITDTGFDIGGLLNSEIFIELNIEGDFRNTLVLGLYKQANDPAIYADLSGLGLPKVKIIGISTLLAGIGSAVSAVMDAASAAADGDATAASAFAEVVLENGRIELALNMDFLMGILGLLDLETSSKTYNDGQGHEKTFTTIIIRDEVTNAVKMEIPLPDIQDIKLSLDIARKLDSITIEIGLDSIGNTLQLAIEDITISTDENFFTNEFNSLQGDNADDWAALILTDINGVSLTNILKNVLDGLDPTIIISLNKKVSCKVTDTGSLTSNYTPTYTSLIITRTNGTTGQSVVVNRGTEQEKTIVVGENSGGDEVYGGKLAVNIDINHESSSGSDRAVAVWLFNNALFGDIRGLSWLTSGIGALGKLRFTDLNIIDLVAGASTAEVESDVALATADEEPSILDTIKDYIAGIEIDWWFNTQYPGTYGEQRYTNIRVNLNPVGINDLLYYVYYLLYSLTWAEDANGNKIPTAGYATTEQFQLLTRAQKAEIVTGNSGAATSSGYLAADCYRKVPYYLQQMIVNLVGGLLGDTAGGLVGGLIDGDGGIGAILVEIITGLLPIPLLDETGTYDSYALITLDKDNDGGIIKEIGIYINREKVTRSGNSLNVTDVADNPQESAEIIIGLNGLYMRAVDSVQWYNTEEQNFGASVGITNIGEEDFVATKSFVVADPFNPVELSSSALGNASALPQRVDATFTGITTYTSKGQNGEDKTDEWVELGGTSIIWDVSQVNLVPGSHDSYIYGYALNKQVIKIPVIVGNNTGFMQIYGYLDANGNFVKSDSITIDTTKPGGMVELPKTIVIRQNNGELRMISASYKAPEYALDAEGNPTSTITTPASPSADVEGTTLYAVGQMGWIAPDADVLDMGGTVDNKFWYKINNSAKITVSTRVEYVNSSAVKGYLPAGEKFDVLAGGDALDIDSASLNIKENIGALDKVNVEYSNGEIREVAVKLWKFDNLKYNNNAPYEGVSGYATAVVTTYGVSGAQDVEVRVPVSAKASVVEGLTNDNIYFSQYTAFTKETLLPDENVDVEFTLTRLSSETRSVSRDEITLFNNEEARTLVLPDSISVNTDTTITVKAAIGEKGVNEQIFNVNVVIKPKTIQAAYLTVYSDVNVADITTMKVLYTDGIVETLDIIDRGTLDELTLEAGGVYPIAIIVGKSGDEYSEFQQSVTATIRVRRTAYSASSAPAVGVIPVYTAEVLTLTEDDSATATADEITLTGAEILGGNDTVVFDPLFDNLDDGKLPYPATVDAVIEGSTQTLTLVKADYYNIVNLSATPNADDASITSVKGGVYTEAVFQFKDSADKPYYINVPVYVVDRQIVKCNLPASFTVNPFTFDANPLSPKFSFTYRQATLTFADGSIELVDILWSNTDGSAVSLPSGFSAQNGAADLSIRAKCGTGLANVNRTIGYELKKVRLASYGVSDDVKALVQSTGFTAYPENNAENSRYYGNFPTSVKTTSAYLGGITLELKWKLETLKYSYAGGETYVEVDIGNAACGYQTMQIPVTVSACEIDSVSVSGLDLDSLLGLDPYTYNDEADIKNKLLSAGVNFVVTYKNGKTRTLTNNGIDVVWSFGKIKPMVVCAAGGNTFNAVATLFNTEYAGGQTYSVPVTFIRREMQAVYNGTSLLTDTPVLNPYDFVANVPNEVKVQFMKFNADGTEAGTETRTFSGSKLAWNLANFIPETSGDRCTMICTLIENGASYSIPVSFEVTPYEAATISRWGDVARDWVVEDGKIWAKDAENNLVAPYTINPLTATKQQQKPANTSITVTFNQMTFGNVIDGTWISGNKKFVIAGGNYTYYLNGVETKAGVVDDNFKFIVNYDEYTFAGGKFTHTQYGGTSDKVVMKGTYTAAGSTYTLTYDGVVTKTLEGVTLDANNTYKKFKSIENVMIISGVGLGDGLRYAKQAVVAEGGTPYNRNFGYVDLKLPAGYKVSVHGGTYTANIRLGKGADLAMDVVVLDKSFTYTAPNITNAVAAGGSVNLPKSISVTYTADDTTGIVPIYWVVTRNYLGSNTSTVQKQVFNSDGTVYGNGVFRNASNTTEFIKTEIKQYYEAGATSGSYNINSGNSGASIYTIVGYVGRVMDGLNVLLDTGEIINASVNVGNYGNNLIDIAANGVWMSTDGTYTMISFNKNNAKSVNIITGAREGSTTTTANITTNGTYAANGNSFSIGSTVYYVTTAQELGEEVIKVTMMVNANGTINSTGTGGNVITFKRVM